MGQIIGTDLGIKEALVAEHLPLLPQKNLEGCAAGLVGTEMENEVSLSGPPGLERGRLDGWNGVQSGWAHPPDRPH